MWIKASLPLAALLVLCNCQTVVQQVCTMDRQMTTVQPGAQVIIGGLFEIRGMGTNGSGCGKPLSDTMQIFEAARFAINFLNNLNSGSGYGGVKFGLNAYDTCVSASNAIGVVEMMYPQSKSSSLFCTSNNTVIAGAIGSLSSTTAIPAAALAGQLPVSLISSGATDPQLSDKLRYPTFLRTVPSYAVFAQVLAQLLQQLQWENILVVYTDDAYGRSGYEQLLMAMYNRGLCVSQSLMLDTKGNKDAYKTALTNMGNISTPVAVLVSPNSLTKVILQAVDEVPSLANLQWVLGDIDITNDVSSLKRVRGALVVVPQTPTVDEFKQYFTQLLASPGNNAGNPWFADWAETTYGCSVTAGNCPTPTTVQFVQSPWVVPTMKAVFAYAEAVRSICNNGVCSRLTTMTPTEFNSMLFSLGFTIPATFPVSLRGQTISFDSNGDPQTSDFTVYNYNNRQGTYAFDEIGRFELNSFTLTRPPMLYDSSRNVPLAVNLTATCASLGCENCLVPQNSASYRYKSGDLVIASLINAHEPSRAPFTCGAGRVSQLVSLVAAEWAVQQYKTTYPSQFLQVSLGSLVADVCPDAAVAQSFITDVLSGNNRLMDSSGAVIPASNIQAFVDATSDDQAMIISPIISDYNIPEVMADVSTSMVSRGGNTPYFTRAAPSDEVFYSAISNVLQGLGWKYVQVATHMSGTYREMADTFTRVAARYGICVVDVSEYFGDGMMDPYNRTVRRLLSNHDTQVVVVFADMMAVRGLLTAIGQSGSSSQLQLIAGTDDWGTNPAYIQGLETFASGVIVVDLDLPANTAFSSYLQSLTLAQITVNPFLRELFEMTNQCALNPASQGMYARICTSTDKFNNVYMGKALSVIGCVNAVASKLHELIADMCGGPNYSGLCSSFQSASDLGSRLSAKLTNVTKINGLGISNGEGTTDIIFYVYNQGWKQFAQFNSESQTLLSFSPSTLGNYQGKLATCSGVCMECKYLSTMRTSIYNTGDWLIAGSFAVSNSGPEMFQPFICGDVKTSNGPQYTMAMLYAIQQVNAGKAPVSVKGVKFGNWIFDHCGNPGRADLIVSDVYAGFMDRMNVDENKILAWLTDTNESSNETVQILDPLSVATISPSATADSLMNYQTFFRTIQGDAAAVTALILIAKAMKYNYIQVVYSANTYGREGLNLLVNTAQSEGVCVTNQIEFSNASDIMTQLSQSETHVVVLFMTEADVDSFLTSASTMTAAKSLLFLLPKYYSKIVQRVGSQFTYPIMSLQLQRFNLAAYNDYINTSPTNNPFFAQFYMKIMQCNLPGYSTYNRTCSTQLPNVTSSVSYEEDNSVLSTIDAVYSVVDALHRTVSEYCGSDYTKPCSAFLAAANKRQYFNGNLTKVNFVDDGMRTFRYLVREGATTFDILQYSSSVTYNKVGSYSGQSLDIPSAADLKYSNITSTCSAPCLGCIMTGITFSHVPGDIYLAGMFDVHLRSLSPFTCDNIKTLHGFLLLEAFHYALEQVNEKQGQFANILPGVRLGGIGLDACESDVRGGYLISNIHSGITVLSKDGITILPSTIDAYIGSYYSTTSIYIARILTDLKIPQISYGSGSEELSDTRVYPFFYRTVPTDNNQVEAVLKLLDKLDIRYVQILYEDNSNGMSAKEHFVASATNYSICVAETVAYPDLGTVSAETSATVVAQLIEKPTANTIVTFLGTQYVNSLLKSIAASDKAMNKFRFIGSDSWADNQDAIQGAESQAFGSITVRLDADDVQAFETYISSKNLANSKDNPWFQDYFQNILNCYISKTNTMGYPTACPSGPVSLINSQRYQQDSDVVYVINAVYAAAFAIHKTLLSACGPNYNTVCQSYRTNSTRHETIRDNLADVSFTDPVGKDFMFVNRSGVASYRFNSINSEYFGYTYKTIGSYNVTTATIMLDGDYISTVQSDCNRPDACAECPAIRDSGVRYVFHKSTQDAAETIIAFFDIHQQGVDPFRCGDINVAGFQQLVTFFYTLERVLSNMNYRILVIDTCSNSLRVDQDLFGLLDGTGLCNSEFRFAPNNAVSMKNIGGVVTVGEANTIAASRVLELPGVTYVSPNALTTLLDSKPHLVRTIAPVSAMMKTLVSLLSKLGWTYVDVLYENSLEGIQPFHSFASYANAARVCRGSSVIVDAYSGGDMQSFLAQLNGDKGSEVVVLFGSYNYVKLLLATANAMSIADRYLWVLGVEWDLTPDTLRDLLPVGVDIRLITLRRLSYTVGGFSTYINSLTYNEVHALNSGVSIPKDWYDEFYQKVFDCRLANFFKSSNLSKPICDTNKQFSSVNLTQDIYTLNLVAATYAVVQGLTDSKLSPPVDNAASRMTILNSILNVQSDLNTPSLNLNPKDVSTVLKFDKDHRWWDSEYLIKFFRVKKSADGSLDSKEDVLIRGDFNPNDQKIADMKALLGTTSVCNEDGISPCDCTYEDIEPPQPLISQPFTPAEPRNYYYYHSNGDQQYDWSVWAIVVAIITSVGLLTAVILFLILIFAYPVRSGTTVLGYMSIIGIIGIYAINFAFFVHAMDATCGARRFLMGVVYMIAIAPLLIKAVDNWRFSKNNSEKERYSGISSAFVLLMAAIGVVLIQCIIPIIWLILVHPTASEWRPFAYARHDNWWCDPPLDYDTGLVQSFIFVMFIVLVTAVFSALTFDSERNNFESRWILLSCIVTAGCFLVWMIVSTSATPSVRDPAVTIGNLVNATLLLLAMPLRKCILLCQHLREKEEQDDVQEVLNHHNGHVNVYNDGFDNPMLDLNVYDNYGMNGKPSDY